ncbi:MAG: ComF family protein [Christensenellaceae bacterium]|nr:ComF family protein [Christensenellaceae bacterium]
MFKGAYENMLDFVFPQHLVCHTCGREAAVNDYGICSNCEDKLMPYNREIKVPGFDGFTAGLIYNEQSRNSIHALKFGGALYQKEFLVHFMKIPEDWSFDCVVPVPLHKKREKERGYNQSAVLAKELCKRYNLVMREDLLVKIRNTPKQSTLGAEERAKNLRGAYAASSECRGMSILLVDDVRTTGSTLKACAVAFRREGAAAVYGIAACCTMTERISDGWYYL